MADKSEFEAFVEAIDDLAERHADFHSEWYKERFDQPDSRGKWKAKAIAEEEKVAALMKALGEVD